MRLRSSHVFELPLPDINMIAIFFGSATFILAGPESSQVLSRTGAGVAIEIHFSQMICLVSAKLAVHSQQELKMGIHGAYSFESTI